MQNAKCKMQNRTGADHFCIMDVALRGRSELRPLHLYVRLTTGSERGE